MTETNTANLGYVGMNNSCALKLDTKSQAESLPNVAIQSRIDSIATLQSRNCEDAKATWRDYLPSKEVMVLGIILGVLQVLDAVLTAYGIHISPAGHDMEADRRSGKTIDVLDGIGQRIAQNPRSRSVKIGQSGTQVSGCGCGIDEIESYGKRNFHAQGPDFRSNHNITAAGAGQGGDFGCP